MKGTVQYSYRTVERKLYPAKKQEESLERYRLTCARLYNQVLEHRIKAFKRRKQSVSLYDQQLLLTKQRRRIGYLWSVPAEFERDALRRVDKAFKGFFRRFKAKAKKYGFPRFKPSHRYKSLQYQMPGNYFRDGSVFVPGIGEIASRGLNAAGKQKFLRIIKRSDAWYACVVTQEQAYPCTSAPQKPIGIDVGLKVFAAMSNGDVIENPRLLRKSERLLKKAKRSLCKKQKGSKNREKARKKLAKLHEVVAAQRKDFAHQESRKIVNKFDLICFENLNIAGLAKSRMAKSIFDAAWRMFFTFVTYKAAKAGRLVVGVNAHGTSQECPSCGNVKKKSLSERTHQCGCGLAIDRDYASALVIEARALAAVGAYGLRREVPLRIGECQSASTPYETGSSKIATQSRTLPTTGSRQAPQAALGQQVRHEAHLEGRDRSSDPKPPLPLSHRHKPS